MSYFNMSLVYNSSSIDPNSSMLEKHTQAGILKHTNDLFKHPITIIMECP